MLELADFLAQHLTMLELASRLRGLLCFGRGL